MQLKNINKVSVTGLQRVGGKMVEDEAGEVAGTRLHGPYILCFGFWYLSQDPGEDIAGI